MRSPFRRTQKLPPEATHVTRPPEGVSSARWTNGSALGSKALSVVIFAALVAGPIALVQSTAQPGAEASTAPAEADATVSVMQQSAGAFALGYVGAWLTATQDDSAVLGDYIAVSGLTLSSTGFEYRNIAVASIDTASANELLSVIVAADVAAEIADAAPEETATRWPRRYFQVAVTTAGDELAVAGLPTPVTGPVSSSSAPTLNYRTAIATTDPAGESVISFLTAYLTGQGAVQPYTSPSAEITAITPAPYSALVPVAIQADQVPPQQPADDARLEVLATVSLETAAGQQLPAGYVLALHARDGRWEIDQIQSVPALAPTSGSSPSPTPSPTGAGTQEGN